MRYGHGRPGMVQGGKRPLRRIPLECACDVGYNNAVMLTFTVYGAPSPKGSTRAFVPKGWTRPIITSATKGLKAWESKIANVAMGHANGTLITEPVVMSIAFHLPRPKSLKKGTVPHTKRPDCDKLIRAASDSLIGIVYKDDAQIVSLTATKAYVQTQDEAPRAEFVITTLQEWATSARVAG